MPSAPAHAGRGPGAKGTPRGTTPCFAGASRRRPQRVSPRPGEPGGGSHPWVNDDRDAGPDHRFRLRSPPARRAGVLSPERLRGEFTEGAAPAHTFTRLSAAARGRLLLPILAAVCEFKNELRGFDVDYSRDLRWAVNPLPPIFTQVLPWRRRSTGNCRTPVPWRRAGPVPPGRRPPAGPRPPPPGRRRTCTPRRGRDRAGR